MNLKEINTLPVIIVAMLSVSAYYVFPKDKALEKKLQALEGFYRREDAEIHR